MEGDCVEAVPMAVARRRVLVMVAMVVDMMEMVIKESGVWVVVANGVSHPQSIRFLNIQTCVSIELYIHTTIWCGAWDGEFAKG